MSRRAICTITLCITFLLLVYSHPLANGAESRIWSDKSGKHEIRAKFVDVKDGKARLERPNGDITRIPLKKLSDEDQKYIRDFEASQTKQPAKPSGPRALAIGDRVEAEHRGVWRSGIVIDINYRAEHANVRLDNSKDVAHFCDEDELRWPGTNESPLFERPVDSALAKLKIVKPDLSDVLRLTGGDSNATKIKADPLPNATPTWKPKSVRLASPLSVHQRTEDISVVSGERPLAGILRTDPFNKRTPRIELVDLRTRKQVVLGPALPYTQRVVISPNATRVATLSTGDTPAESVGQIHIWNLEGKQVTHLVGFAPYAGESWPDIDPEWIAWIDEDHLLTTNDEGRTYLWKVGSAQAVYELLGERRASPVLSPGRKHLAIAGVNGVSIYDALTGDQLATVGSGNLSRATLAFSPAGDQIAAVSSGFVDVIDVTTGELTRSFPCPEANGNRGVTWVDQEYLFVDNRLLINVPRRIVAWEFEITTLLSAATPKTPWVVLSGIQRNSHVIAPLLLPPPGAEEAIAALDEKEMLAVQPGATVSVQVKISDGLLAKAVKTALVEAVEAVGMQVSEDAQLTLHASMTHGESEKINYRKFHDHFGKGETINVTKRIYELQLRQDGVTIWERKSVHSPPYHLRMEKGENIRAAIARVMKPTAANFRSRIPTYVVRPEFQGPLGTSKISSN